MPDIKELVGPQGQPLHIEQKLIVIKVPKGVHIDPRLFAGISQVTGCAVVELPMACELMMGDLAAKEMASVHTAIHAISELPVINFTKEELSTLYSAMRYLCERTAPTEGSKEVLLLKQIKKAIG
ncbi:MAG: hypothetical protein KKH61_20605 [Gammaproteobacteria bacterium]|nr:hypothetical protein [Gammaproteobacteria bacterium]